MAFSPSVAFDYLHRAHQAGRLGHAYLLAGEREAAWRLAVDLAGLVNRLPGAGRAGAVADAAVRAHPNVHVVEPESRSRRIVVEQIRQLEAALRLSAHVDVAAEAAPADADGQDDWLLGGELLPAAAVSPTPPAAAPCKVAVLRDADRLQPQAANAFLKTLEEPPAHCLLLLLSAQPEAMLETILSRCIRVTLRSGPGGSDPPGGAAGGAEDEALLGALRDYAARPAPALPDAYRLLRVFQDQLNAARARLSAEAEEAIAADERRYVQTTDAGADWVAEREKTLQAQTEARYAAERTRLLGVLDRWWGDVLRRQSAAAASGPGPAPGAAAGNGDRGNGGGDGRAAVRVDLPAAAAATAALAARLSVPRVLDKLARLEELREHLERNVQEALALEVAFLRVFGSADP